MNIDLLGETHPEEYLRIWKAAFKALVDWDAARVEKWVGQFHPDLDDEYSCTYHEEPIHWVINLILPRSLGTRFELYTELNQCISIRGLYRHPDFDWEATREPVDQLLGQFGESLASRQRELNELGLGL